MTTVVITQPMLFPWPGFFEQLQMADVYIYLDDAQFTKRSFTNRVQMRVLDELRWMTVPLVGERSPPEKRSFQKICDLRATSDNWRYKHENLTAAALRGAPWAELAIGLLREVYATQDLPALLISSIEQSARHLGLTRDRRVLRSSDMGVEGRSWQRILDLVHAVGGTRYLTGHGAAHYLDHEAFESAGIAVEYVDYSLTKWTRGESEKTPYISVLDLIGWAGPEAPHHLHPRSLPWRDFLKTREEN